MLQKNKDKILEKARKCYYYGCAGTRVCTFEPWTTRCTYPECDKRKFMGDVGYTPVKKRKDKFNPEEHGWVYID